jgi:hypothetical protein
MLLKLNEQYPVEYVCTEEARPLYHLLGGVYTPAPWYFFMRRTY